MERNRTAGAAEFLAANATFRRLARAIGEKRARLCWDIQDRILATAAAAERERIEAIRSEADYDAVRNDLADACVDAMRTDPDLMDAFDGEWDLLELAAANAREQVPPFLATRPGQSHTVVYG